jgi:hypothetical protein
MGEIGRQEDQRDHEEGSKDARGKRGQGHTGTHRVTYALETQRPIGHDRATASMLHQQR